MARKRRLLECGCCGDSFRACQHWNFDTGYGRCRSCCDWILERAAADEHGRWEAEADVIRAAIPDQWPEAA
jgi:hypothetical protein